MEITIICIPFQVDVARCGCAGGPQAFLDAGIAQQIEARGHSIRNVVWIELPKAERTRDSVTNLGRIAERTSCAVNDALAENESFVLVLEGDCTHAVGTIGGLAQAKVPPEAAALIGTSDLDAAEREVLQYHPVLHIDASQLMQSGVAERVQSALRPLYWLLVASDRQ